MLDLCCAQHPTRYSGQMTLTLHVRLSRQIGLSLALTMDTGIPMGRRTDSNSKVSPALLLLCRVRL